MPVIVAPDDYARWLDPAEAAPADLIGPYPSDAMRCLPVSTRVNAVRHDDSTLIEPIAMPEAPEPPQQERPAEPAPPRGAPKQSALF